MKLLLKRICDICLSFIGLIVSSPITVPVMVLIWMQDFKSPFYIAPRVGKNEKIFNMIKLRSMVVNADANKVDSTSKNDTRITPIGKFVRKCKLDELSQLWNVLKGEMSLVGPRPNVKRETDLYTPVEKDILKVQPGITDISSIVFSDEGDILAHSANPDLDYNQLIRPWKSRLCLLYIQKQSLLVDIKLIFITALAILSRKRALKAIHALLIRMHADEKLIEIVKRDKPLIPTPPPGADQIVQSR